MDAEPPLNLRRIDLNLLTVFEAVFEERSQQRASERLHMSQPAISHAISRLRHLLGDALFQGNRVLEPTARAQQIYPQIRHALDLVRAEFTDPTRFDPQETRRTFHFGTSYGSGFLLGAALYAALSQKAPKARLAIHDLPDEKDLALWLRTQRVDLAVAGSPVTDPMLETAPGLDFRIVAVVRSDHPRLRGTPSVEDFRAERFVWVGQSEPVSEIPELQAFIRWARENSPLEVPNALLLPTMVVQTELVALMPLSFVEPLKTAYPLRILPLPFEQVSRHSVVVWHRSLARDPAVVWFLDLFRAVVNRAPE
jgi:DNA-binding transcriptional LysR family regulator